MPRVTMSTPKPTKTVEKPPAISLPPLAPPDGEFFNPPDGNDDDAIMAELAQGNQGRFQELFNRYQGRLLRVLASNCPTGVSADDVAQETWLKVVRSASKFELGTNFPNWLMKIGNNSARDAKRRMRNVGQSSDEILDGIVDHRHGEIDADTRQAIADCFDKLPERSRKIVGGRWNGETNIKIAEYYGLKEPTTSQIYSNSLQQMGECIEEKLS